MSTFPSDPLVADAVAQLADALHVKLLDAVETAANRCFDSVEDDLRRRSEDIGAASRSVTEFLQSLGEKIRADSGRALSDELKARVVPALEAQASSILDATERRIGSSLTQIEGRVNGVSEVVGKVEKGLIAVAKGNTEALAHAVEHARAAISGEMAILREAASAHARGTAARISESHAELRNHLREAGSEASQRDQDLRAHIQRAESVFRHGLADAERCTAQRNDSHAGEIKQLLSELEASSAKRAADHNASHLECAKSLEARTARLEERLLATAARHQTLLNRIWYLGWACAALAGGVLTAVLMVRR